MVKPAALFAAMAALGACSGYPGMEVTITSKTGHGQEDAPRIERMLEHFAPTKVVSVEGDRVVLVLRSRKVDRALVETLLVPHTLGFHPVAKDQGPVRPERAGLKGPGGAEAREDSELGLVWQADTCQPLDVLGLEAAIPSDRLASCLCESSHSPPMQCRLLLLERAPMVTGRSVVAAEATPSSYGETEVDLTFDDEGARRFAEGTRAAIGRRMAVVLDGRSLVAPLVNEAIPGGRARISLGGAYNQSAEARLKEAVTLSLALRVTLLEGTWTVEKMAWKSRKGEP